MGKYLHHYETESAFTAAYNGEDYLEPWVSYTDETEGQEHVDYNKQPVPITVKYVHINRTGQGQYDFDIITDEVVEYDDTDVPFYDLVEDYILASKDEGYDPPLYGYLGVIFAYFNGEMTKDNIGNPIEKMTGGACAREADPRVFGDSLLTTMSGNMTLYDFNTQKFSEDALGKTIYIRLNDRMLC